MSNSLQNPLPEVVCDEILETLLNTPLSDLDNADSICVPMCIAALANKLPEGGWTETIASTFYKAVTNKICSALRFRGITL